MPFKGFILSSPRLTFFRIQYNRPNANKKVCIDDIDCPYSSAHITITSR